MGLLELKKLEAAGIESAFRFLTEKLMTTCLKGSPSAPSTQGPIYSSLQKVLDFFPAIS
jgi:hypothetical protein